MTKSNQLLSPGDPREHPFKETHNSGPAYPPVAT